MRSSFRWAVGALALVALVPSLVSPQLLSKDSTPIAYHLKIDASNLTTSDKFSGAVLVNLTVSNTISYLLLHSENLTLNESSLVMMKKHFVLPKWDYVNISSLSVNRTWLNVTFFAPLAIADYSLSVEFEGRYQSSMAGFAKVGYLFKGEKKYLGVTGLEPTNARKVFPCYDTPGFRIQFKLELTVSRPHTAISNVRPTSVHNISDTERVFVFDDYPSMPVHQLAWAVVDQTSYTLREDNSTPTTVHTRAPYLYWNQTNWANQLTAQLVQAVGEYTAVLYNQTTKQSHSKIEQIVLPEFFSGTSEGYGFMSFSEDSILVAPTKSSTEYIQDVALTLARAVVQQWFGDIVSIDSWDNIWILKGQVHFLQFVVPESLSEMSDWELGDQAVLKLTQPALAMDSPDRHPITVHSNDETELVTTASDFLTKYKGGALFRMLQDVFGSSYKEVMSMYILASYPSPQYNPTTPEKFWNIMYQVATDQNVNLAQQSISEIMQQWITAPGYPVVAVTSNTSHFIISQSNTSQWWVPVSYSLQGSPTVNRDWLQPGSSFSIPASSATWLLLNLNQTGFYRVNYTSQLWKTLSKQLMTDLTVLPRLNRAQLIDDVFYIDLKAALEFSGFLRAETDYFPWATALRNYQNLINTMAGHSSYQLLQNYLLDLMNGVIASVGFTSQPKDTHIDRLKRSLVLEKACEFGHQTCIQKAVTNLRTWMAQTYYDVDLSPALLCAGVANSSTEVWHNVQSMYRYSVFPSVRLALLKSLTCTQDQDLLYQFLDNVTSTGDPLVSAKDKSILLQTLSSKPFGARTLLNWLVDRLQAQVNRSSAETSTPAPEGPTPMSEPTSTPTTTSPDTTSFDTNQTTDKQSRVRRALNSNFTTVLPTETMSNQEQQNGTMRVIDSTLKTVMPTEKLPESDVVTILNLILPMLTTLEEGTKLDTFVALGNSTGLSNATLEIIKNTTQRVYIQAGKYMKTNALLTTWLETEATTSSTGVPTNPSTQTPSQTTTPRSSASNSTPGITALLVCALALFHVRKMT